jgi:hypothetical protein
VKSEKKINENGFRMIGSRFFFVFYFVFCLLYCAISTSCSGLLVECSEVDLA